MNKVGTDTRKSPQRLLQNNVQPALFILTLPLGNTLYLLLSIYSSITLCLNQRFKTKGPFETKRPKQNNPAHPCILPILFKTILPILKSFLSWFIDKLSFVVYTKRSKTNFPFLFIPNVQKHPPFSKPKKPPFRLHKIQFFILI